MADTNETTTGFYGSSVIEVYDGHMDSALYLSNVSGNTYRLGTLPLQKGEYTFTVWAKAIVPMALSINVLGLTKVFELEANVWTKLLVQNPTPDLDSDGNVVRYVDITPVYYNTAGEYDNDLFLYQAMLELSDRAADWSPAPEDDQANIDQLTTRVNETELKLNPGSITAMVLSNETYKDSVKESFKETRADIKVLSDDVSVVFSRQEGLASDLENYKEEQKTWYRFSDKDGFEIGKTEKVDGHQFLMNLTNRELSFRDNGAKVAYINDQVMHITDTEVEHKLVIGDPKLNNRFAFVPTETGMALIYVG